MAKNSQKQVLKQQQKLTPQQIMAIKLLEIPSIEIKERIEKELQENPLLEIDNENAGVSEVQDYDVNEEFQESSESIDNQESNEKEEGFDIEDFMNDPDEFPEYKLYIQNDYGKEDRQIIYASYATFKEELERQLGLNFDLTFLQKEIAKFIIGSLDDRGYLNRSIEEIADDFVFKNGIEISEKDVEEVLKFIQQLDPPGIGARNLKECLLLQLEKKLNNKPEDKLLKDAYKIVKDYFDELTKKHYDKLISKTGFSKERLEEILEEIKKLNPKPGLDTNETVQKNYNTITPDFILEISEDGSFIITLNDRNTPALRISSQYLKFLDEVEQKKEKNKEDQKYIKFVRQKKDDAEVFINALVQRQNTLLKVMKAIAEYQREFFLTQDEKKIKPMILKDIADMTGLDVSTVSRVASNKYVQTPFGILHLKSLFSDKLSNSKGEEISNIVVKKELKEIIEKEDKRNPFSDEALAKILKNKGYKIARRTVAKYREQLGIPDSRLRKEL